MTLIEMAAMVAVSVIGICGLYKFLWAIEYNKKVINQECNEHEEDIC